MKYIIFLLLLVSCTHQPRFKDWADNQPYPKYTSSPSIIVDQEGHFTYENKKLVWVLGTGRYANKMPKGIKRHQIRPSNYGEENFDYSPYK